MNRLKILIFFPLFYLLWKSSSTILLEKDLERWCKWKELKKTIWTACSLFVSDKAFRNLFYYRGGRLSRILSIIMPGYDHLQITTPCNDIGPGLVIQHGFATIISAESIGQNCKIYQQVTIGYNHKLEAPKIGDNVEICCGAKVIGGVVIGNNVIVGANAVVLTDVPDNSIVAGIPAKVIKRNDLFIV